MGRECTTLFRPPLADLLQRGNGRFPSGLTFAVAGLGPAAPGRVRTCCVAGFHRCAGSLRHSGRALLLPFAAFMCYVRFSISGRRGGCQRGEPSVRPNNRDNPSLFRNTLLKMMASSNLPLDMTASASLHYDGVGPNSHRWRHT